MQGQAVVLGAAGFVGRHAARSLAAAGWCVSGIGHGSWSREEWRRWGLIEWHSADVTKEVLLTYAGEPDLVVQCAGSGAVGFSMTHPEQDFHRSVAPTLAALEFIRLHAPRCRMVLPSSAAVYGSVRTMPIAVDAPNRPESPYGVHKQIAEQLCRSYARTFHLAVAIVRLFSVYGVGLRKQLLWDACVKLTNGRRVFDGNGDERRDWLHVEDAAALLITAAAHAGDNCPTINGGTGTAQTIRTVVGLLELGLGLRAAAHFSGDRRGGDPIDYEADVAGAYAWGWRPERTLEDGIADYARWYLDGAL